MADTKRETVLNGFLWRFLERTGAQGVTLIVSVVLARLLSPSDYGLVALVTVFTTILQVFVDAGFGIALVQKKDADDLDFSTVFYFNLVLCVILYLAIFIGAPAIAAFYKNDQLVKLVRVTGIIILISGVKNIQQAYVSRNMLFRRFFYATLAGTIGAAIVGIYMAYKGYGVWALVAQLLFNKLVDTIVLWFTVRWRPIKAFSFKRLSRLFSFGWKLLVSQLLDTVYTKLRQLIIGKVYTSEDLAFYNKGDNFPSVIVTNINTSIDSVLLPAMSSEQDSKSRVREMTRRAIMTSTYIMAPLMMGLAFVADSFVRLLLTEKWLPCVPYLRIFCITYMFYPIHTANLNAMKALGRSDLFLKLEIIKKIMGLSVLVIVMNHGVMAIAYSLIFTSVMSQIINSWPNRKLLGYSYIEQLKDILPGILLAVVMGIIIYPIQFIKIHNILVLTIQVVLGAIIYLTGSMVLKLEPYYYLKSTVKNLIKKKG